MTTQRLELLGGDTGYVRSDGGSKLIHRLPLPLDDVHSLRLLSVPDELERVAVHIGARRVLEWECGDIGDIGIGIGIGAPEGANLLPLALCDAPHVLPLSLSRYMTAEVVLHYRADFVMANEEWSTVEEAIEHEEYSDTESEFFDGGQVSWGRRVHRTRVPTGRLARKVTGGAQVRLPIVEVALVEPLDPPDAAAAAASAADVLVPFWQKIVLSPDDRDYALRLEMTAPVPDATDWLTPRAFVVKNRIRFSGCMAGVTHRYER